MISCLCATNYWQINRIHVATVTCRWSTISLPFWPCHNACIYFVNGEILSPIYAGLYLKVSYFYPILTKIIFSQQILVKFPIGNLTKTQAVEAALMHLERWEFRI